MSPQMRTARLATRHSPLSGGFAASVYTAFMVWRQRQHLAELDDARLDDLGITRAEAEAESRRPLWDAPAHWRRG
jgi:uncharacterized protein YjiS (DUF1127 family)